VVSAPATSANLGPGFDVLALALDLSNVVKITPRPGPLSVSVEGEGADDLPTDASNLVCRALESAAVCAGLVAANAIGGLRWTPDDLLERATAFEGHADNAAACLSGGLVAVAPGPTAMPVTAPEGLDFILVIPDGQVSTSDARVALPSEVPLADAATTLCHGIGLVMALSEGRLEDLPPLLHDRLHEPYRGPAIPCIDQVRAVADSDGCFGVTISGSGPSLLVWCESGATEDLAAQLEASLDPACRARVSHLAPVGVRARWAGNDETRLERAIG
jgi:homoserine kinase